MEQTVQGQVYAIADGRARADIETQAADAFTIANERRAAHRADDSQLRALAWAKVLRYMDRGGDATFDAAAFEASGGNQSIIGVYGLLNGTRMILGRKPFTFYAPPPVTASPSGRPGRPTGRRREPEPGGPGPEA